jgi:cytochrome P450
MVDLMIDPIERVTADVAPDVPFDMHATMVEATLRLVANALFSQDFGQLVGSMNDLATRGLRRTEKFGRLGLWGLMPRPVYDTLMWCTFSGVPLPPPFREAQRITLALDEAVNAVLDERIAHPTDSPDLLNVLFRADNGTWSRKRIRDEAHAAKDRPRSAYLPFGGGRRICIGQSFALTEMVLMTAIMSQRFTFDLCPDHQVELEATLTLRPKHGVHVIAHRREGPADVRSTGR